MSYKGTCDVRTSSLDDPKCFACRWLDDVRCTVDRVTQRGIETHLVNIGIAAITSATIFYVHAVIRAFGVVSIAVFESVATVCTRDVRDQVLIIHKDLPAGG